MIQRISDFDLIPVKLVANYGAHQTFFSSAPSESDEESAKKITGETSVVEMEKILTAGQKKKWKTVEEFQKEWKETPW